MLRAVAKSGGKAFLAMQSALNRRLDVVTSQRTEFNPEAAHLKTEMADLIAIVSQFEVLILF